MTVLPLKILEDGHFGADGYAGFEGLLVIDWHERL
jgi:hypothetical protein